MSNLLNIVKISGTHHLKGGVKGVSYLDDIKLLEGNKVIVETPGGQKRVLTVVAAKSLSGNKVVLEFEELNSKSEAALLANALVYIKRELIDIEDDEYLVSDLIGMEVVDNNHGVLGKLTDVFETGAHDIYVVNEGAAEIMIPVVDEFVKDVDFNNRKITTEIIDGMLPEKG